MDSYLRMLTVSQLRTLPDTIRLIVIHPNFTSQRHILYHFDPQHTGYIRFDGQDLSTKDLHDQLTTSVDGQQHSHDFILDECDRAAEGEFAPFLVDLLGQRSFRRVIVFSREIPHCIIQSPTLRAQAAFVPHDEQTMLWDYPRLPSAKTLLEVRAFGKGQILRNGYPLNNWDGALPHALFFYMIDRGMVKRTDIFATFWSDKTTAEATNVFHVTKRKVNEILGLTLTKHWSGFYRIAPEIELSYDVTAFKSLIQASEIAPSPEEAIKLLSNALAMYQDHFLSTHDMPWVTKRRGELHEEYSEALTSLAQINEAAGNRQAALGYYLQALSNQYYHEDLIHPIIRLCVELDQSDYALNIYDRFLEETQTPPSETLLRLIETIQT